MPTFRTFIQRNLGVVGFIILALAVIFALGEVRGEGKERRESLAASARLVVIEGCNRDNDTRRILREIINDGAAELDQYVKEGLITPAQAERARKQNQRAIKALGNTDCKAAASVINEE